MNKTKPLIILLALALLGSCHQDKRNAFTGYVQAQLTYISAYYTGILKKIEVQPGETVTKGQPLFTLEAFPEHAELQAASARVQQAREEKEKQEANFVLQKKSHERNKLLFNKEVISREELEQSNQNYQSALANKQAAQANLLAQQANEKKASWVSQQNAALAPVDALIFDVYYSVHEKVAADKPVLSLLTPDAIKVVFYIPEALLGRIKLNQSVEVTYDGLPQPLQAKITYISPKEEYTPPVIFSENERQKLVYRVEAMPMEDNGFLKIHPGQPVTVLL